MNINPGQFLEFLQEMICKSFESELKSRKRILFYSKQKNLLIIWQGLKDGIIVTLEEYINSCGESYHLHIIDQDESFELLAQWSQKMADYLWEQSLENIPDQALIIANTYQKSFKNIVLDPFKDPDQEGNYAIATLSNLEIECLYLNESKLCWFEISDPKKNSEESSEVRQIFVPNHCNQSDFLEIVGQSMAERTTFDTPTLDDPLAQPGGLMRGETEAANT
ncbi:hypothetical protein MJH12_20045, partial [bacterium]|nr:hypothetical protein [bacterium]